MKVTSEVSSQLFLELTVTIKIGQVYSVSSDKLSQSCVLIKTELFISQKNTQLKVQTSEIGVSVELATFKSGGQL